MRAVWLSPSPAGLPSTFPAGVPEVSRFSCTKLPGVSGVYDYAGLTADSRLRLRSCCLPLNPQRRRPDCNFSKLDTQPTCTSVYASPGTSRHLTQNSRPSGSLPLSRKTLPFSASCRFIPAHEFPFWCPGGYCTLNHLRWIRFFSCRPKSKTHEPVVPTTGCAIQSR